MSVLLISPYGAPYELLILHGIVLSLGQMAQLIMILLSLTAVTLC